MKLLQRFISSSVIVAGIIVTAFTVSDIFLERRQKSLQDNHFWIDQAIQQIKELEICLEQQTSALKDYILLDKLAIYFDYYSKSESNCIKILEHLSTTIPELKEVDVIRKRHQFILNLAKQMEKESGPTQLKTLQQDIKAVNSFRRDIVFFMDILVRNFHEKNKESIQQYEQFKNRAKLIKLLVMAIVFFFF